MKIICLSMLSAALSVTACGAEFTLRQTSDAVSDLTVADSYEGSKVPQSEDTLIIPEGVVVKVTAGTPSWTLLTGLCRVVPRKDSVLAITVPEGNAVLPVPVTEFNLEGADNSGTLVKEGAGVLELSACGIVTEYKYTKTWSHDYDLNLKIEGGTLMLCQNSEVITEEIGHFSLRRLEMEKDTIFFMPKTDRNCDTRFMTIAGEGLITNAAPANVSLYVEEGDGTAFGGILGDKKLAVYVTGDWTLTNPDNTNGRGITLYTGTLSVSKTTGDSGLSVFGVDLTFKKDGGVFHYLGAEGRTETSTKTFWLGNYNLTFDGGAWGGLTLYNKWGDAPKKMRRLTFTGSNVAEMVYQGYAYAAKDADGNRTFTDYIIKEGTGTWHFKERSGNQMAGVFDVRNGALRFDSIAEAGTLCALGYADSLYNENTTTTLDEAHKADYAIVLGGAKTEGTLEYTGTAEGKCSTRNIAVRSKGRFISDSAKYTLANVYAMDGKSATFTLDGVRTDNVAMSLSDGKNGGSLSVVKEGSGTWTLTGTNEISGPLIVRSGILNVENSGDIGCLFSCGGVGVSGGGELNFAEPYEVDRIVVDASKTAGSFRNVVLAEKGALEVVGYSDSDMTTLPVSLPDAGSRGNIVKWTLTVNGVPSRLLVLPTADGTLKLHRRGLLIKIK